MSPPAKDYLAQQMSEQEYLESEPYSEFRREYIDGYVYAMAGAKNNHNLLSGNVFAALHLHLRGNPCRPYMSDMKTKVDNNYFYPDVIVDCSQLSGDSVYTESPTILVEVLSKSTRQTDKTIKRYAYTRLPSLQEYMLIEQDFVEIELWRRSGEYWEQSTYYLGDVISFDSIGLSLSVEDIYERVQNEDMTKWLAKSNTP